MWRTRTLLERTRQLPWPDSHGTVARRHLPKGVSAAQPVHITVLSFPQKRDPTPITLREIINQLISYKRTVPQCKSRGFWALLLCTVAISIMDGWSDSGVWWSFIFPLAFWIEEQEY
jgi:hypothetical protein